MGSTLCLTCFRFDSNRICLDCPVQSMHDRQKSFFHDSFFRIFTNNDISRPIYPRFTQWTGYCSLPACTTSGLPKTRAGPQWPSLYMAQHFYKGSISCLHGCGVCFRRHYLVISGFDFTVTRYQHIEHLLITSAISRLRIEALGKRLAARKMQGRSLSPTTSMRRNYRADSDVSFPIPVFMGLCCTTANIICHLASKTKRLAPTLPVCTFALNGL